MQSRTAHGASQRLQGLVTRLGKEAKRASRKAGPYFLCKTTTAHVVTAASAVQASAKRGATLTEPGEEPHTTLEAHETIPTG